MSRSLKKGPYVEHHLLDKVNKANGASDKKAIKYKGPRVAQSLTNFTLFHDP